MNNHRENPMRKLIPALITASILSGAASADTLGVYAGMGNWKPDFKGSIADDGGNQFSAGEDGNIREKNQSGLYIAFEHPIPVIPNIMVRDQDMSSSGQGDFVGTFDGEVYTGNVSTQFDLSHRDYTLYYEILDNWVNLDLGLSGRKFDGFVQLEDNDTGSQFYEKIDQTIPMLYGKARFDLPLTGLSLSAIVNYISASGSSISDTSLVLGYETSIGLGLEGGLRTFNVEVDDNDELNSDLEFDGVFINATFHF